MPDLPTQQSQKELEYMAGLQRARSENRQTTENKSDDPVDDVGNAELKTSDQSKKISKIGLVIMLILAIIKDVGLDAIVAIISPIPGIGQIVYFLTWIIGYFIIAIIYIWAWTQGKSKLDIGYKIFLWLFGTVILESIPYIKDIATSLIIFVIYIYWSNIKVIKRFEGGGKILKLAE